MSNANFSIGEAEPQGCAPDALARATQECFRWSSRWSPFSRFAQRYWEGTLIADAARTIVALDHQGHLGGFVLLVLNEKLFKGEMSRIRRSIVDTCGMAAYVPIARVCEWRYRRGTVPWGCANLQYARRPRPRTWIELIAVRPECRGHKLGYRMLSYAEKVSVQHGARAIEAVTAPWNVAALTMFQRAGYLAVDLTKTGIISSKSLITDVHEVADESPSQQ